MEKEEIEYQNGRALADSGWMILKWAMCGALISMEGAVERNLYKEMADRRKDITEYQNP